MLLCICFGVTGCGRSVFYSAYNIIRVCTDRSAVLLGMFPAQRIHVEELAVGMMKATVTAEA